MGRRECRHGSFSPSTLPLTPYQAPSNSLPPPPLQDMGPATRCLGNSVPPDQPFQDPLPPTPKKLADFAEVRPSHALLLLSFWLHRRSAGRIQQVWGGASMVGEDQV